MKYYHPAVVRGAYNRGAGLLRVLRSSWVSTLAQCLLSQFTASVRFSQMQQAHPGFFERTSAIKLAPGSRPAYPGKVVILVDELSQSQAEYPTMSLRIAPRASVLPRRLRNPTH